MIVNTKELAEFLDITQRRVQMLEKDGILEKNARNEWDLKLNFQKYLEYKLETATSTFGLTEARAKKELAEAELKNLLLKEKKQEVIPIEKLEVELSDIAITLSNTLYNLPNKLKRTINLSDEVEEALNKNIEEILISLKDSKIYKKYS